MNKLNEKKAFKIIKNFDGNEKKIKKIIKYQHLPVFPDTAGEIFLRTAARKPKPSPFRFRFDDEYALSMEVYIG